MTSEWAAQRLEEIQTLMERSTLYRRALAPTSTLTGCLGMAAGWLGWSLQIEYGPQFCLFWMLTSLVCLTLSSLMIRKQALVDREPFWSPPTRRVATAMAPALVCGAALGFLATMRGDLPDSFYWGIPPLWMLFYGCALFSAGFFMPRGIKLFGAAFVLTGLVSLATAFQQAHEGGMDPRSQGHIVMGSTFGFLHFAYGIYLFLTEKDSLQAR